MTVELNFSCNLCELPSDDEGVTMIFEIDQNNEHNAIMLLNGV